MSVSGVYNRVLLKLSGNALGGENGACFSNVQLDYIGGEIADVSKAGCAVAVVVGAGNILRGAKFSKKIDARLQADSAGMVATVVNGLMLRHALDQCGVSSYIASAFPLGDLVDGFNRQKCLKELEKGRVLLLVGGTGNPLFTTDSAAALRSVQLEMDILLKATRVDGVYSADPESDKSSEFLSEVSYQQVLDSRLEIMDFAAIDICREHSIPVRVFNFKEKGNLRRAVSGDSIGTFVGEK